MAFMQLRARADFIFPILPELLGTLTYSASHESREG